MATIGYLDRWLLVGVRHGLLARAPTARHDAQLDEDLAYHDPDLGQVVDLEALDELIPALADPPQWLLDRATTMRGERMR